MGKHIPKRMCIACRSMRPKSELMRIVKTEDGAEFDENQKILSRGIYLCKNEECIKLAQKKKAFERIIKTGDVQGYYERAREIWIKSLD